MAHRDMGAGKSTKVVACNTLQNSMWEIKITQRKVFT